MAGGKHVRERSLGLAGPFLVLGRHLAGDDDATGPDVGVQHLADEALAVSIPVRQRGIEERDSAVTASRSASRPCSSSTPRHCEPPNPQPPSPSSLTA